MIELHDGQWVVAMVQVDDSKPMAGSCVLAKDTKTGEMFSLSREHILRAIPDSEAPKPSNEMPELLRGDIITSEHGVAMMENADRYDVVYGGIDRGNSVPGDFGNISRFSRPNVIQRIYRVVDGEMTKLWERTC